MHGPWEPQLVGTPQVGHESCAEGDETQGLPKLGTRPVHAYLLRASLETDPHLPGDEGTVKITLSEVSDNGGVLTSQILSSLKQ